MNISPQQVIISKFFEDYPEVAANVIAFSNHTAALDLIKLYPASALVNVFNKVPAQIVAESLIDAQNDKIADLFSIMEINIVTKIFRKWKQEKHDLKCIDVLEKMDPKIATAVKSFVSYPKNAIGSLMKLNHLTTNPDTALTKVLSRVSKYRNRFSKYIYVVDTEKKLEGVISFKDIFYDNRNSLASELMTSSIYSLKTNTSIDDALKDPCWMKWDSVPVINSEREIQGVLKLEDLREYINSEVKKKTNNTDILKAGEAVGDIFKIGLSAAISAFSKNKEDK